MLARISRGTAHALGLTVTRGRSLHQLQDSVSLAEDPEEVIIDLDVLLLPVHDFFGPWWRYAGECGRTIAPVYHSLQSLLSEDVERIAQLLLSLESPSEDEDYDYDFGESTSSPSQVNHGPPTESPFRYHERPPHKQQFHPETPVVIPSSHTSLPTIVITPCEDQSRETSALVPIQDSAFSSKLTVPFHPKVNCVFPPMARNLPSIYLMPELDWRWRSGHWQAFLPVVEEQTKKGMFSRAISRRKGSRRCRTSISSIHTASRAATPVPVPRR